MVDAATTGRALTGAGTHLPRGGAAAQVRALAGALAEHAVPALQPFDVWKSRLPAPQLLPVGVADAARAAADLGTLVRWVDDGDCFARAVVGAARIEQLAGAASSAAIAQARHAAVAVVPTSWRQTGWTFHAAPVLRTDDGAVHVVDHLLAARAGRDSGLIPLEDWAGLVGRRASDVRIQGVLDNQPTGGGPFTVPATGWHLRQLGERLARRIERAG